MKNILIVLICLVSISCSAQEDGVKYFFSKDVNSEIDRYIKKVTESSELNGFYLTVFKHKYPNEVNNHVVYIKSYEDAPPSSFEKLIRISRRYYLYNKEKIPVIFDYDFEFISYGEDPKGRPLRKIDMNHSYYFIEFNTKGKIVETGH